LPTTQDTELSYAMTGAAKEVAQKRPYNSIAEAKPDYYLLLLLFLFSSLLFCSISFL